MSKRKYDLGNPLVRIWENVYKAYKKVALKHDLLIGNLMSIILIIGVEDERVEDEKRVTRALIEYYGLSPEKAREIAEELKYEILKEVRPYVEA